MSCEVDRVGIVTIISCSRGQRAQSCSTPGCTQRARFLCDAPVKRAQVAATCDRAMCERCAKATGEDLHICPVHARLAAASALQERIPGM